jgi:hypothetical protein
LLGNDFAVRQKARGVNPTIKHIERTGGVTLVTLTKGARLFCKYKVPIGVDRAVPQVNQRACSLSGILPPQDANGRANINQQGPRR